MRRAEVGNREECWIRADAVVYIRLGRGEGLDESLSFNTDGNSRPEEGSGAEAEQQRFIASSRTTQTISSFTPSTGDTERQSVYRDKQGKERASAN